MEHLRNARKYRKRVHGVGSDSPHTKKSKLTISISGSPSQQLAAMEKELMNMNPRDDVLIALMNSTFEYRKSLVEEKKSVTEITRVYPALKRSAIVCYLLYSYCYNAAELLA